MATLVYTDVDGVDRSFSLGHDPVMVGRAADCAIRSEDPRVSRMHARFFLEHGTLWVEDLGSSNGIYVGPQKVQRAPVPIGEIVLIGSLMIRLLPANGTMPPPIGLHGTLAQWLEMERKTRAAVEDERNAFARRVGELHDEMRILKEAQNILQEEEKLLRTDLDQARKKSVTDVESLRLELAKAKEERIVATTAAGLTAAEKLAEMDSTIAGLQNELAAARAQATATANDPKAKDLQEQLTVATLRAEKIEKELQQAQIRAQGAERNLQHANMQAAKAETKVAEIQQKLDDAAADKATAAADKAKIAADLAAEREKVAQLMARLGQGTLPVQAAEQRAAKLANELADMTQQLEGKRDQIAELEKQLAAAKDGVTAAEAKATATRIEVERAEANAKTMLAAALEKAKADRAGDSMKLEGLQARLQELEARLQAVGGAEAEVAAAKKDREEARERTAAAEKKIAEALGRADEADNRARAADTMAKAMAKDVAEALRRAVDADSKARAVGRELEGAHRRAAEAEERDAQHAGATKQAEDRAAAAEQRILEVETEWRAKLEQTQKELGDKLRDVESELNAKADKVQAELKAKADQIGRELAAERSTAMSLVDRKTQLERELNEARTSLAGLQHRLELAESKVSEYEVSVEQLEDKIQDLEAGVAVEKTAASSTIDEAREQIKKLEDQLSDAKAASKVAAKNAANLEARIHELEAEVVSVREARSAVETAVSDGRIRIVELERLLEEQTQDAEDARSRVELAETRARDVESRAREIEARAKDIEARAKEAAERIVDSERRGRDLETKLADAVRRAQVAEEALEDMQQTSVERVDLANAGAVAELQQQLAAAKSRIEDLELELERADNVRQFAANTEREIAALERELRDVKVKLTQVTLERDRAESNVRDFREDSETMARSLPRDVEGTPQPDLARYTALVARAAELEQKLAKMEKEDDRMRRLLVDAEERLAAQHRANEDEPTSTAGALPIELTEYLSVLEESIDSLRSNMRAASDETAMMDQTEPVVAISSAVSQAEEHVERARDALRALAAMVGMGRG